MSIDNPFHRGELEIQELTGESDHAARNSRMIAREIVAGAIPFIKQQAMAVVGSISSEGHVWASIIFGQPGFAVAVDPSRLELNLDWLYVAPDDPLWQNVKTGNKIALLFIELETRRRLRVNGIIDQAGAGNSMHVSVQESFPNCPQYIQRRKVMPLLPPTAVKTRALGPLVDGQELSTAALSILAASDVSFVASVNPEGFADVSHRGGQPGFIQIVDGHTLRMPDYSGNGLFNTMGNFLVNPNCGLTVVDFNSARALQMQGQAFIELNRQDLHNTTGGTGRFWRFVVDSWQIVSLPVVPSQDDCATEAVECKESCG